MIVGGLVIVGLVDWFVVWQTASTFTSVGDFLSIALKVLAVYIAFRWTVEIIAERLAVKVAAIIRTTRTRPYRRGTVALGEMP